MRIFKKAATSTVAVVLLAFGAVAGSGSAALAVTEQPVTGCNATIGALALGLEPNCTAGDSTINDPTSVTITVNTTSLGALLNVIPGEGLKTTWTLSCVVNGSPVSVPGSYTVTTTEQSASTTIDLQTATGSPQPTQCTVSDLTAETTLALSLGALSLNAVTVGASATATTATPGAIYSNYPSDSRGAHAVTCADDTGNGESGTVTQAFQCLSDQAEQWTQVSTGQFVHNGDCLTDTGGRVTITSCVTDPTDNSGQIWTAQNPGGAGTLTNADGGGCLTAPASGTIDTAPLKVATCANAVGQAWTVPQATPAV